MNKFGVVVIGRNEGDRLLNCLKTLKRQLPDHFPIVYVDSGSSDGSLEAAESLGIHAISLDPSMPFTMARGRNSGFEYLTTKYNLAYIQFIDGDCELVDGWLERAVETFKEHDQSLAIVCGRRRERFPEASIYNKLIDLEWKKPIGEVQSCGGDSLVKVTAIKEVGGFNSSLICGEEPELCIRLRRRGWKILSIDADMTLHDADIKAFSQWWRRLTRSGWAGAQGMDLYGAPPERYKVQECFKCWLWGPILLSFSIILCFLVSPYSIFLLLIYPLQMFRYYQKIAEYDMSTLDKIHGSFLFVLIKFPHAVGQVMYFVSKLRNTPLSLIEYKSSSKDC
ncbi:MAG: hypothetical protein OHK0037_21340 [Elainellaceae cyanobacterium]